MFFTSAVVTCWLLSILFCGSPPVPWRRFPDPTLRGGCSPRYHTPSDRAAGLSCSFEHPELFGGSPLQLWAQLCSLDTQIILLTPSSMVHHYAILPMLFRDCSVVLHKRKYPKKSLGFAAFAVFSSLVRIVATTHHLLCRSKPSDWYVAPWRQSARPW